MQVEVQPYRVEPRKVSLRSDFAFHGFKNDGETTEVEYDCLTETAEHFALEFQVNFTFRGVVRSNQRPGNVLLLLSLAFLEQTEILSAVLFQQINLL